MKTSLSVPADMAFSEISREWKKWADDHNVKRWVVGVSGGVDSTVVLKLACDIFGSENVWGVMLPCGTQKDIADAEQIIAITGANRMLINIADAALSLEREYSLCMKDGGITSEVAHINLPPRIRMSALYMVAQSLGAMVLNTSNLSEDMLGYATLWGDTCGSYAPIQGLTKTEVIDLAKFLKLPDNLAYKTPADGLQDKSDEERLGLTYAAVDKYIRNGEAKNAIMEKVQKLFKANMFKLDMVNLPGPKFSDYPNNVLDDYWKGAK